jgi:hypothetical protein
MSVAGGPPDPLPPGDLFRPAEDTVLVDTYGVKAAIVYPEDMGAINLTLRGRRNADDEPVEVHMTLDPELGLALARDLRLAFARVPLEKRHART